MNELLTGPIVTAPTRSILSDDPADILTFAVDKFRLGDVALASLVEINGGAARALGAQVAIAGDGHFCGYVSGGCVESAVASEALLAMALGQDRIVQFGQGSPYYDIVLPCGGGITVAIHLLRNTAALEQVIDRIGRRQPAGLRYTPVEQRLEAVEPVERPGWIGGSFISLFSPATRLVVSGRNVEGERLRNLARASGYDVMEAEHIDPAGANLDAYTAVAMLHHDLEAEERMSEAALRSPAFYIGALGSSRTHRRRIMRLQERGWQQSAIRRIKAPIGSFGPTRDSTSLALSILSDIAASRLSAFC